MTLSEIVKNSLNQEIIELFLKKSNILSYNDIKQSINKEDNLIKESFEVLIENNIIEHSKEKEVYSLKKEIIQPIRDELKFKAPILLIGGLGDIKLYTDVLDALETLLNLKPSKYFIITSPEINSDFQRHLSQTQPQMQVIVNEFDYRNVLRGDYNTLYQAFKKEIYDNVVKNEIIFEIKGGNKKFTIKILKF